MCENPILIIATPRDSTKDYTVYKRKYRFGLPTSTFKVQDVDAEWKSNEVLKEAARQTLTTSIAARINPQDYPFLTQYQWDEIRKNYLQATDLSWMNNFEEKDLKNLIHQEALFKPVKFTFQGRPYSAILVPCGKCSECSKEYRNDLEFMITKDVEYTPNCESYMLTLTYDQEHLNTDTDIAKIENVLVETEHGDGYINNPIGKERVHPSRYMYANQYGELCKPKANSSCQHCETGFLNRKDLTDFIKRLRITLSRWYGVEDIKFFYCGEYGKKTFRPHYHLLLWFSRTSQCDGYTRPTLSKSGKKSLFAQFVEKQKRVPVLNDLLMKKIVFDIWDKCRPWALQVEECRNQTASARYISKYVGKQKIADKLCPELANSFAFNVVPPFCRASSHLAHNWANSAYDTDAARKGYCTISFTNKSGELTTYTRRIPRRLLNYIDDVRCEMNLPILTTIRKSKNYERQIQQLQANYNPKRHSLSCVNSKGETQIIHPFFGSVTDECGTRYVVAPFEHLSADQLQLLAHIQKHEKPVDHSIEYTYAPMYENDDTFIS